MMHHLDHVPIRLAEQGSPFLHQVERGWSGKNSRKRLALQHLSARLTCLADQARVQEKLHLEATLIEAAAELLISAQEIAVAPYCTSLIERLATTLEKVERGLKAT